MPFQGFKPLADAYRGFGRFSLAATAGAGATALALPALLRNDDRGYAKTSAITTPAVASAYVAAPALFHGLSDLGQQWSGFVKRSPITLEGGIPRWKEEYEET